MPSRRLLIAGLVAVALGACVTPSIPIPPPEPEHMVFAVDASGGVASFSYGTEPHYAYAVVYVFNKDKGTGIITTARADGSVGPTAPFPAAIGDNVSITFETEEVTASRCVVIREGVPSPFDYCTR